MKLIRNLGLFLLVVVGISGCTNPIEQRCDRLVQIAMNGEKVRYLRQWADNSIQSASFLKLLGDSGPVANDTPIALEKIDLDWDAVGINRRYGGISLKPAGKESFLDGATITSIGIAEGRSSIVLRMNASSSFDIQDYGAMYSRIVKVNNDVFVLCE